VLERRWKGCVRRSEGFGGRQGGKGTKRECELFVLCHERGQIEDDTHKEQLDP